MVGLGFRVVTTTGRQKSLGLSEAGGCGENACDEGESKKGEFQDQHIERYVLEFLNLAKLGGAESDCGHEIFYCLKSL